MAERKMNDKAMEIYDDHGQFMFSIEESVDSDAMVILLNGKIKNEVAHDFEDEVIAALSVCRKIILDMRKLTYIASVALKSLLSAQQLIDTMDGASMTLVHVSKEVMKILDDSGFSDLLAIEEDT